jgi:A/G-specific adenine glycosylase
MRDAGAMAADLLAWYDRHARAMPWRVGPAERAAGVRPDPYRVWLSEVMLQQTTVAAVRGYFQRFTARWPDVQALAAAEDGAVMAEWAGLGYYARARNLLACARAVAAAGGRFPDTEDALRALPGVGRYTAAAVAAIAFDRPAVVVDGNVERVMARLHAVETPLPAAKPALTALAAALTPAKRPGDHAQAVMDLGATICTPRRPACGLCPWAGDCVGRAAGLAADLPRRAAKAPRPLRQGTVWAARREDGAWLMERRPARGLLGGMLGFPGTAWDGAAGGSDDPPLAADWRAAGPVHHVFTHFGLALSVQAAAVGPAARPLRGAFVPPAEFSPGDLPSVMRKALDAASRALSSG